MDWIANFIYVHAAFGGIALLSGALAIFFKKGSKQHKTSGKVFYYNMLISAIIALIIAVLPGHENSFLFSVGLFSLYFILIGKRALQYKKKTHTYTVDILLSYAMVICSTAIIVTPFILGEKPNIVQWVFGSFGVVIALLNIKRYAQKDTMYKEWLPFHIGNIMGGYISAFTAFIVVNNLFPPAYAWIGWILPGVIGGFYISYWINKIKPRSVTKKTSVDSFNG